MRSNILNLYIRNDRLNKFVRIFIFPNKVLAMQYELGQLVRSVTDLSQIIILVKHYPVELILYNRNMSCRTFSSNKLQEKDIKNLAQNNLKEGGINTVFYCKEKDIVKMCMGNLNENMANALNCIINNGNIIALSAFPYWVVEAFLFLFPIKTQNKVFIIQYMEYWHIVIVQGVNVLYNRSGNLENFNSDIELKNTLTHVKHKYKFELSDLAIFYVNSVYIDRLWKHTNTKMKILSTVGNLNNKTLYINKMIKLSAGIGSLILTLTAGEKAYELNNLQQESLKMHTVINQTNKSLLKDLDFWQSLEEQQVLNQLNYSQILKQYMEKHPKLLKQVSMYIDKGNINVEAI